MYALLLSLPLVFLTAASAAGAATLGIVVPGQESEEAARVVQAVRAVAEERGWDVEVGAAAGELIGAKPLGLILVMAAPGDALQAARDAGIPAVTVLAGTPAPGSFDLTVNQYAAGADIGAHLLGLMGYRGRLIALRADAADPAARARARVLDVMLQDSPGVPVIATVQQATGRGWQEALRRELDAILAQTGTAAPLALWAARDELALVAEEVLKQHGWARDRVTLVSTGGSRAALARLRDPEGLLTATLVIPYELLGEAAVEVIGDLVDGTPREQIATSPVIFIDPILVDRGNVPPEDELPW